MDVSIIIPAYNRLWSIEKAISSCFETKLNIEVIVIDDGSNDGTFEHLIKRNDIILLQQENQGKDWAVNNGFKLAQGKYIRFLDSDDWLTSYSTDKLFELAEKKELDLVTAGYTIYSETEEYLRTINWVNCDDFIAQQLGECDSSHYSAYLFKKSFIDDIPHRQEYGSLDDRKFILEVALKDPIYGHIDIPTLAHRMHGKERLQISKGLINAANHLAFLKIYQITLAALERQKICTERRKKAAINYLWPLATWIAKHDINSAYQVLIWIKKMNPNFGFPKKGTINFLYRMIGFKLTSHLLKFRRMFKNYQ